MAPARRADQRSRHGGDLAVEREPEARLDEEARQIYERHAVMMVDVVGEVVPRLVGVAAGPVEVGAHGHRGGVVAVVVVPAMAPVPRGVVAVSPPAVVVAAVPVVVLVVVPVVVLVMVLVVPVLPAAGVGGGGESHPEETSEQGGGQQGEPARDPGRHGVLLVPRTTGFDGRPRPRYSRTAQLRVAEEVF